MDIIGLLEISLVDFFGILIERKVESELMFREVRELKENKIKNMLAAIFTTVLEGCLWFKQEEPVGRMLKLSLTTSMLMRIPLVIKGIQGGDLGRDIFGTTLRVMSCVMCVINMIGLSKKW